MKWLNLLAIVPILLGILIFKGAVSGRKSPEKDAEPEAVVTVKTETVEVLSLPRVLTGFGTVVADRQWTAVPQVSGRVTHVHSKLKTGEFVAAGQVLFVVETIDQGLEQQRIVAENKAFAAEIQQVEKRREQLEESRTAALAGLQLLKKEEERYQRLFQQGATPESTVEARRREVLNQQRGVEEIEATISTLPHQIEALEARIQASRANLAKQGVQVDRSVVKAPFTGRLQEVYLEEGQVVNAGSQLFTLQGSEQVRVEARFPIAKLNQMGIQEAFVTTPSGRQIKAEIGTLREQIDQVSRTASVQLLVNTQADQTMLPGALVKVLLEGSPHPPHPVVPRSALHEGYIFTVVEGRLQRTPVEVSFREGDFVAIKSGLKEGEQIVVSDPGLAMDGSLVRVAPKDL